MGGMGWVPVLLTPAVVRRLRQLDDAADLATGLPWVILGPAWLAEDSHSPWID